MPEDLPIYSESMLRTRLQFADLEKLKGLDLTPILENADRYIEQMEGASDAGKARTVQYATKAGLLQMHAILFSGREGAGKLRWSVVKPLYRGHDCPEPQFIDRSLDNFFGWLTAESISEIHPIERAALLLTRIVDIWPFEFGNLTTAIVFANQILSEAGFAPFFVLPEHTREFNTVVAQAMTIEMQPLVNAIYKTVKREMEALAPR
ncbi:MAG TPA: Fic family protein [Terriglobia bacterium]|nr:Fic family protein [Terriglobia bacterium]